MEVRPRGREQVTLRDVGLWIKLKQEPAELPKNRQLTVARNGMQVRNLLQVARNHCPGDRLGVWERRRRIGIELIQCDLRRSKLIPEGASQLKVSLHEVAQWACESSLHAFTSGHSAASMRNRSRSTLVYRKVVSILRCPSR